MDYNIIVYVYLGKQTESMGIGSFDNRFVGLVPCWMVDTPVGPQTFLHITIFVNHLTRPVRDNVLLLDQLQLLFLLQVLGKHCFSNIPVSLVRLRIYECVLALLLLTSMDHLLTAGIDKHSIPEIIAKVFTVLLDQK